MTETGVIRALCRPGFEADAGQELVSRAAEVGGYGFFVPEAAGWIRFELPGQAAEPVMRAVSLRNLVFVRDWYSGIGVVDPLPGEDRVGAVLEGLRDAGESGPFGRVDVHVPLGETEEALPRFARKWTSPLAKALRGAGILQGNPDGDAGAPGLEILLPDFSRALLARRDPALSSAFHEGVPRLRMPGTAPSRSTLKLEEALHRFFTTDERERLLRHGMTAVDLGAAPGGWTWQLVQRGLAVTAVDNGPMDEALMASGLVTHRTEDAFSWRPSHPVDWLVCDIVDRPARVVELMAEWLENRLCRLAVFNLKLPMKQRWACWQEYRARLEESIAASGADLTVRAAHLYHDREEITCCVAPLTRSR
ncbi:MULTISPECIES: 23S rRNA (cytidine(2498)-2'-O)-methyltransferase RlmM [Gammaproteobacteria]|uniref:23S rRNA (Cytidine(2498)-2'-O)-methyltransferase RlmM n=1 Tax=Vreelandella halophila TaxID=86177 RepID=A0A9X5B504_9GAMM|nr:MULTISPECIES: 23S rRNA (cytidine(2498)-2'-O)-methyltransferase RlmM [Gammaproteobacteria]KAA8984385.1 23S rRNA (cytidine(2498)-2'-O)-methyltransferase RlmM [Halospina sp. K52047b]MYL26890.1 23S rRNA (cytidine(2498)-2'-O)-methyltransferase RlmM [Halomonas utahensis]MYL74151.1 23S rRNA (cytidine(2498)-2'-O)-methyltransferase RlmM [Halomonas sp. 22501_18_FS]